MEVNGSVIHKDEKVQEYLDAEIVGETELKNGTKSLLTQVKDPEKHVLIGISQAGKPFIRLIIPNLFETIKSLISSE